MSNETQNTTVRLNRFLDRSAPSATFAVFNRIFEKEVEGQKILSLCVGESDFDTPAHISEAGIEAIKNGYTRYTQVAGVIALRHAVSQKFSEENNIPTNWDETIVCNGGKQVIFNALSTTLNEGDEVIIPAPYWENYPKMVEVCGGTPVIVFGDKENAFKLSLEALDAAITPQTRWLIINSPSNPTGAVYSKKELLKLADVLRKQSHVMVLSDDIYEHLVFDDLPYHTMAEVAPDLRGRILTMNGVSKAYAMTGWRIGFGTGPKWLISAMAKLQAQQTSGASSISQHAALAALEGPKNCLSTAKSAFKKRRDLVARMINDAPGLSCEIPAGALYIFADCGELLGKTTQAGKFLNTDEDVAAALLEEMNVAVVHGSAFGMGPFLRIAYTIDDEQLKRACLMIQTFCRSLSNG
jgi:aspartate aminotransferase